MAGYVVTLARPCYVTPDYQIDLDTGQTVVYYRFGNRLIACASSAGGLRYLLGDHLTSTHGEVSASQADLAQRRYYPFGSDRAVSGASDLARDERFTGQPRVDAGGGNARRELYYYGARWYLPGVGIFTQPDTIVPDFKNPQALNRYAYGLNNPLKYVDPTGHDPEDWFRDAWKQEFRDAHQGADPTAADYAYRFISMAIASGLAIAIEMIGAITMQSNKSADLGVPSWGQSPDILSSWDNALGLLLDWYAGTGEEKRNYEASDLHAKDMQTSLVVEIMRQRYAAGGYLSGEGGIGTFRAAAETFLLGGPFRNPTQSQLGAFNYWYRNNGDGTVTYSIQNALTVDSFFYHLTRILGGGIAAWSRSERASMGTVLQSFRWTEFNPVYQ